MKSIRKINLLKPVAPSKDEIKELYRKKLTDWRKNPNAFSYWFPRLLPAQFKQPKTIYFSLLDDDIIWLLGDKYTTEETKAFGNRLITEIKKQTDTPDLDGELFIKTGNFSNKFDFETCHLKDIDTIGQNFLDIFYSGMLLGCPICPEIVVREFIHTSYERDTIYFGMKLNTEFRVFYDFTAKKLLAIYPYWDRETMQKGLGSESDLKAFDKNADALESDFNRLSPKLKDHIREHLDTIDVDLSGIWSLDFLWTGTDFYFIDAAVGENSAYYEKLITDEIIIP